MGLGTKNHCAGEGQQPFSSGHRQHDVSVRIIAVLSVLSDSPYERIGKWETCSILKVDGSLVRVQLSICDKNCHIIRCIENDSF
jgi:hypothetical protein